MGKLAGVHEAREKRGHHLPNKRIVIEWDGYGGRTTVERTFSARQETTTYVVITEPGWTGAGDGAAGLAIH